MTDLFTPSLAAGWIARLAQAMSRAHGKRREAIDQLSDTFGDAPLLAKYYVGPNCQLLNPADVDEDEPLRDLQHPISAWIDNYLRREFKVADGRNTVFVLSDAGMGKTSLLMMLKLTEIMGFWPKSFSFEILVLGKDTLDRLKKFKGKARTVLLLDALDEDPAAIGRIKSRVLEILVAAKNFRRVFITCRTQFFPRAGSVVSDRLGKVKIGGFTCNLLYLSPFSDQLVDEYLSKRYPSNVVRRAMRFFSRTGNPRSHAKKIVSKMQSLRMRPMLLAHIEDLMEQELRGQATEYTVYDALIRNWLEREERRLQKQAKGATPRADELWDGCLRLALLMQDRLARGEQARSVPAEVLEDLLKHHPADLSTLDFGGKSLLNRNSEGAYRFAHYSIQEFLVTQSLLGEREPAPAGTVKVTDQIWSFTASYIGKDRGRLERAHWELFSSSGDVPLDLQGIDLQDANLRFAKLRGANLKDSVLRNAKLQDADLVGVELLGADLQGADLQAVSLQAATLGEVDQQQELEAAGLTGINLQGVNLQGASLHRTKLPGVDLQSACLQEACFEHADLRYTKLKHANLKYSDLRQASMQGADLQEASIQGAKLQYADLKQANLENAKLEAPNDFRRTDLQNADLRGAILDGANLQAAYLFAASLQDAKLRGVILLNAQAKRVDLRRADLADACLRHGDFQGSDLRGADLRGADFRSANLRDAKLQQADLRGSKLENAKLENANLENANLEGLSFLGVHLHGAKFHGADLQGADLQGKNLSQVDLRGANLEGANLHGAKLQGADLKNANLRRANLSGAYLQHVDLRGVSLEGADLQRADLDQANLDGVDLEVAYL